MKAAPRKRSPKNNPSAPIGLDVGDAQGFVVVIPDAKERQVYLDIIDAAEAQRNHDPLFSYVLRLADGVVLKIRNGSSQDLKRLAGRHGGHL